MRGTLILLLALGSLTAFSGCTVELFKIANKSVYSDQFSYAVVKEKELHLQLDVRGYRGEQEQRVAWCSAVPAESLELEKNGSSVYSDLSWEALPQEFVRGGIPVALKNNMVFDYTDLAKTRSTTTWVVYRAAVLDRFYLVRYDLNSNKPEEVFNLPYPKAEWTDYPKLLGLPFALVLDVLFSPIHLTNWLRTKL